MNSAGLSLGICPPVSPAVKMEASLPLPTQPTLPDCLRWERVNESSCDFDVEMCHGWTTPADGSLFFQQVSNVPIGSVTATIPGSQSGTLQSGTIVEMVALTLTSLVSQF